jgi:hypothetical protein
MARQFKNKTTAHRVLNVSVVLILAYSILIIAVFLRAKGAVCSATSSGIGLSIALVSSQGSLKDTQKRLTLSPVSAHNRHSWSSLLPHHSPADQVLPDHIPLDGVTQARVSMCCHSPIPRFALGHPGLFESSRGR